MDCVTHGAISAKALERRLRAGQSLRSIASELGMSASTLWRVKQELGLSLIKSDVINEHDNPAQIKACLSCEQPSCTGVCKSIKDLRTRSESRPS